MTDPVTAIQATTLAINSASELLTAIADMVPKFVTAATVLAAFLPAPEQVSPLAKLHKLINVLAFNFRHAANASSKDGE